MRRNIVLFLTIVIMIMIMINSCQNSDAKHTPTIDNDIQTETVIEKSCINYEDIISLSDKYDYDINRITIEDILEVCKIKYIRKTNDYYVILKNQDCFIILRFIENEGALFLYDIYQFDRYLSYQDFSVIKPGLQTIEDVKKIDPSGNYNDSLYTGTSFSSTHKLLSGEVIKVSYDYSGTVQSIDYYNDKFLLEKDTAYIIECLL